MATAGSPEEPGGESGRAPDDLDGLDPQDPEVQAFAAHLDRIEHPNSRATVEGMLRGVEDFAQCANRTQGHRRVVVLLVVGLMLVGVVVTVWNALGFVLRVLAG